MATVHEYVKLANGWIKEVVRGGPEPVVPPDAASCPIPGGMAYAWVERLDRSLRERMDDKDHEVE